MENKFTVLVYAGNYVDETKLFEGIYSTLTPILHKADRTIESMCEGADAIKQFGIEEPIEVYKSNLRKCNLIPVTLSIQQ